MALVVPRGHRPKPHLWVIGAAFGAAKLLKQLLALLHLLFLHRPPLGHELSDLRALRRGQARNDGLGELYLLGEHIIVRGLERLQVSRGLGAVAGD